MPSSASAYITKFETRLKSSRLAENMAIKLIKKETNGPKIIVPVIVVTMAGMGRIVACKN